MLTTGMAGKIKGAAFREFLRWYGTLAPDALREAATRSGLALDPDREGLGILSGSWYAAAKVHALLDELLGRMPEQHRIGMARSAARFTMDRTLRGLYKVLFDALATPERYARHAQRLFSAYYDVGHIEVRLAAGEAESRISNWAAHHPFMCELHQHAAGFLYEAMGCKEVSTERLECITDGKGACRFRTRWNLP